MSMVWPRRAAALSLQFAGRPPTVVAARYLLVHGRDVVGR